MSKTPKLRFKEFSGDWIKTTIGNEFNLSSGTTPSKAKKDYFNGCNCWVTSGELKSKYINSTIDRISEKALTEYNLKKYPIGTFIIAIYGLEASGTRGSCSILNTEATISQACMAFTPKSNISTEFLYYWYMKYGEKIGIKYAQGTKQQNLSTDLVSNINISVPSIQEQEKIVSFISLIDDKISLQNEKIEMLKDYKKGMMQKIFSRELRFKDDDGRDYPEWEEKKVYELGEIITGNTPSKSNADYYYRYNEDSKFSWITPTDIKDSRDIYEGEISLTEKGYNVSRKLPQNTILVTCIASIGKNAILKVEGSCNQQINAIISNNNNYYEFIYYLMEYNSDILKKFAGITATPILNKTDFSNLMFKVPVDKNEQVKISNILGRIDSKIEKEQEKLNSLNEYKKGLLQQMLV